MTVRPRLTKLVLFVVLFLTGAVQPAGARTVPVPIGAPVAPGDSSTPVGTPPVSATALLSPTDTPSITTTDGTTPTGSSTPGPALSPTTTPTATASMPNASPTSAGAASVTASATTTATATATATATSPYTYTAALMPGTDTAPPALPVRQRVARANAASPSLPVITGVAFTGSADNPQITITGSGFGSAPQAQPTGCQGIPNNGSNYGTDLSLSDGSSSHGFYAGGGQSCIGFVNLSFSDTRVSYQFGYGYAGYRFLYTLGQGDTFGLNVYGASYCGIVDYSGNPVANTCPPVPATPSAASGLIPWHPHQHLRLGARLGADVDLSDGHLDLGLADLAIPALGPGLAVGHTWDSLLAAQGVTSTAGAGWESTQTLSMGGVLTGTVDFTDASGAVWPFVYVDPSPSPTPPPPTPAATATPPPFTTGTPPPFTCPSSCSTTALRRAATAGGLDATAVYTSYQTPLGLPWQLTASSTGYVLKNVLTDALLTFDAQGRLLSATDA